MGFPASKIIEWIKSPYLFADSFVAKYILAEAMEGFAELGCLWPRRDYEGSSKYLNIVSGLAGPGRVCLSEEAQDNPGPREILVSRDGHRDTAIHGAAQRHRMGKSI